MSRAQRREAYINGLQIFAAERLIVRLGSIGKAAEEAGWHAMNNANKNPAAVDYWRGGAAGFDRERATLPNSSITKGLDNMATAKEREEFIARFVAEYAGKVAPNKAPAPGYEAAAHTVQECLTAARALMRNARTHGNLAVEMCNGCPYNGVRGFSSLSREEQSQRITAWGAQLEKRQEACNKRIREICAGFNLPVSLGGDPRGYTVKVKLPSGAHNTWGGSSEGYGVPQ